jgi:hypothetical protein
MFNTYLHSLQFNSDVSTFEGVKGGRLLFADGNWSPRMGLQCLSRWWPIDAEDCIRDALEIGYRHFDVTFFWNGHQEISNAIQVITHERTQNATISCTDSDPCD